MTAPPSACEDDSARACGTPWGWRRGCRLDACRAAHNAETRDLRRAWAHIPDGTWHSLLRAIRLGRPLDDAAERHGLTVQAVWAAVRTDPSRAEPLDAALEAGRDPSLRHGTVTAYRARCRCRACRDAKAEDRGQRRHRSPVRSVP